jgi:hypothetical protein
LAMRPQGINRKQLAKLPGFRPSWPVMMNLKHAEGARLSDHCFRQHDKAALSLRPGKTKIENGTRGLSCNPQGEVKWHTVLNTSANT